jgi:hypothetical protein
MVGGTAGGMDFSDAILKGAEFRNVDFTPTPPSEKTANPEAATTLEGAVFVNVEGLSKAQIDRCKEKKARFESGPSSSESTLDSSSEARQVRTDNEEVQPLPTQEENRGQQVGQ